MKVLFSQVEIENELCFRAHEINSFYSSQLKNESLTIIPVLKGGVFFYVDLVRHLIIPNTMGVISTSHYPDGKDINSDLEIKFIDADIKDRHVLIVDEICYTGQTLKTLKDLLYQKGAKDVRTVVLLNQPKEHENLIHIPDWSIINYYGKEWVAGYGLDIDGLYRNRTNIFYFENKE